MERSSRAFQWGAFFASVALPGAGHAIAGHAGRGSVWLAMSFVTMLASAFLAWWWLGALVVGLALCCVIYVTCCIDAYRAAATRGRPTVVAWVLLTCVAGVSYFVAPVAIPLVIRWGALEAFKIPSGAMCPTLAIGDHFFLDKTAYRSESPQRGDIIVYKAVGVSPPTDFVHRIVAVAGDQVDVHDGDLSVNGKPPATSATTRQACEGLRVFEEELGTRHSIVRDPSVPAADVRTRVPRDAVFVLGDNRDNSFDSRHKGPVPLDHVRGRIWRRWLCGSSVCWNEVR